MLKGMDGDCLFLKRGDDGGNCPFEMTLYILGV